MSNKRLQSIKLQRSLINQTKMSETTELKEDLEKELTPAEQEAEDKKNLEVPGQPEEELPVEPEEVKE